jgi:translocation and assembly module TamA
VLLLCAHAANAADWIIDGANRELTQNLRLHLGDIDNVKEHIDEHEQLITELTAPITNASQALGYYHLTWTAKRDHDDVRIDVQQGARTHWRDVDVVASGDGSKEAELQKVWQQMPMKKGDALNHGDYEKFKRRLLDTAHATGYLDANFSQHSVKVDADTNSADVVLHLETGPVFTVRNIEFTGSRIDPNVLKKMSALKTGDRYRTTALAELYGALFDSGYFREINIEPKPAGPAQRDIVITLHDAARHQVVAGVGFSTDTGARIRLGWNRPTINKAGHSLQNELRLAELEQSFTSEYRIPLGNPLEHYIGINAGWRNREVEDTNTEIFNAGIALNNKLPSGWHTRYGLDFDFEKYHQGSEPANEVFYSIPGVGWDYTYQEGPIRLPDFGYKFWINTDASVPALGADSPFARLMVGAKWINVWRDRHELQLRGEAGAISQADIEQVPASRRFFTGGDQTVRGYSYLVLAPEDDTGAAIGGRYMNVASIEYSYRLRDDWHVATFVDTGRAYTDPGDPFHSAFGVGLHWQTLVGPIRFDIARPVDDSKYKAVHLHITMGPSL